MMVTLSSLENIDKLLSLKCRSICASLLFLFLARKSLVLASARFF